jgi:molybdate/tungstate transport system substrate-binding protein
VVRSHLRYSLIAVAVVAACSGDRRAAPRPPLTVFAAASLARPLEALSDSFQMRDDVLVQLELGGSLEQSRKLTELGRVPDVLMLADDEVVAALVPTYLDWYVRFATNRVVVAFGPRSRHADSITTENWWRVLARRDVTVGRADPSVAPAGRHALRLLERAETYYERPDLADSILAHSPTRYLRPNATELAALLETGEVDYLLDYESVARQYGFNFVALPEDLAQDILYGIAVPRQSSRVDDAVRFVAYVLSGPGKSVLRSADVDVLRVPVALGTKIPPEILNFVRTLAAAAPDAPPAR